MVKNITNKQQKIKTQDEYKKECIRLNVNKEQMKMFSLLMAEHITPIKYVCILEPKQDFRWSFRSHFINIYFLKQLSSIIDTCTNV